MIDISTTDVSTERSECPDLGPLIGSRICHDLISPIGAISNGVELLMMGGAAQSPEMALIMESVTHANARIRFFRVAFGAATGDQRIGTTEVTSILSDMTRGGRLLVSWQAPSDLLRAEVKQAFLALMCMETAMPWGGRVSISHDQGGWQVLGQSARLRLDADLWGALSQGSLPPTQNPAMVHFLMLASEASTRLLRVDTAEDRIEIRF